MKSKRKQDVITIKVKYLQPTNYLGARIALTQSNTGRRTVVPYDYTYVNIADQVGQMLDEHPNVKAWSVVINPSTEYSIIAIELNTNSTQSII